MAGYNFASDVSTDSVLSQYKKGETVKKLVRVVVNVFQKAETGFYIYEVEDERYRRFSITGTFPVPLTINSYYEIEGIVVQKDQQWSLSIASYKSYMPQNEEGIIQMLQSLQGLDGQAHKVYSILGKNALSIIATDPELVTKKISGVNMTRATLWQQQLVQKSEIDKTIEVLLSYGINLASAKILVDRYGTNIGSKIIQNPYFLTIESGLIPFSTCDKIAMQNNFSLDNMDRIMAAMLQVLRTAAVAEGHCCLPKPIFTEEVYALTGLFLGCREAQSIIKTAVSDTHCWSQYDEILEVNIAELQKAMDDWQNSNKNKPFRFYIHNVSEALFTLALNSLKTGTKLIEEENDGETWFSLYKFYDAEKVVASAIRNIQYAALPVNQPNQRFLDAYCKKNEIHLEERQQFAASRFTEDKGGIFVLNGAAGCGKTFTLKVILGVLRSIYYANHEQFSAKIIAPTGKAAKVASQATGLPAATIHRELGIIGDETAQSNELNYINVNCLIIDEFSMVDIRLAQKLFSHIAPTTKVILLGDIHQLSSIAPGMVLHDIIESGMVEVVTLDVVKRQSQKSGILTNATKIIEGNPISSVVVDQDSLKDNAYLIEVRTPVGCRNKILEAVNKLVTVNHEDPLSIQVLCPQKKTDIGTDVMNFFLQQLLNPVSENELLIPAKQVSYTDGDQTVTATLNFKRGDRVIHTKNDYTMEWYYMREGQLMKDPDKHGIINGETGVIERVTTGKTRLGTNLRVVVVKYEDRYAIYQNEFSALQHAYAITIHKSQGSQWPIVLAPIMSCNGRMLSRQILYTMYTRASETNMLFCQPDAVQKAIMNNKPAHRYTFLQKRLKG